MFPQVVQDERLRLAKSCVQRAMLTTAQISDMVNCVHLYRKSLTMRCAILSRAGQVLANGNFIIQQDENGNLRLDFRTDGGKILQGGIIEPDGDLTSASKVLYRQFFEAWGVGEIALTAMPKY